MFDSKVEPFKYSASHIRKALAASRLGGSCLINLCATGETLLSHEVIDIVRELLEEGHYIMIVTNATLSNRIDELAKLPPHLLDHLFLKFSYHYAQLKQRGLLEKFFDNIRKMRNAGASFTLEVTPYDELLPLVDELNQRAIDELGALPHYTVARDDSREGRLPLLSKMSREEYRQAWGRFDSPLFDFKFSIFEQPRREFCYAGDWSGVVDLRDGTWRQCYYSAKARVDIFTDTDKPIPFKAIGHNCLSHHCWNGHVWLGLGDIPRLKSPTYAQMRNRICADGSEWLKPSFKLIFSQKFAESHQEYSLGRKFLTELSVKPVATLKRIVHKINNSISD